MDVKIRKLIPLLVSLILFSILPMMIAIDFHISQGVAQPVAPAVFCSWHGGSCGDAFNAQFVSQRSNKSSPIVPRK
jgi:hypothetical protein